MAGNPNPEDYGWTLMTADDRKAIYFRWKRGIREELVLTYDRRGNLHAWSVWENVRKLLDQDTDRRHRLNRFLAESLDVSYSQPSNDDASQSA